MDVPDHAPGDRRVRSAAPGPLVEPGGPPLGPPAPGEDRILTVPNVITLVRLCVLPLFVWLLLGRDDRVWAAVVLALLGATDWVDGWVARRFNQTSRIGRLFDPTADRILFFVSLTAIIIDTAQGPGGVPIWFVVVVLVREVVTAVVTVTLLALGAPPVDVTWWGKAGTFGLMTAFPWLLAGSAEGFVLAPALWILGWCAAVPGLALSFYATIRYIPLWREAWREGRVLREARRQQPSAHATNPTGPT